MRPKQLKSNRQRVVAILLFLGLSACAGTRESRTVDLTTIAPSPVSTNRVTTTTVDDSNRVAIGDDYILIAECEPDTLGIAGLCLGDQIEVAERRFGNVMKTPLTGAFPAGFAEASWKFGDSNDRALWGLVVSLDDRGRIFSMRAWSGGYQKIIGPLGVVAGESTVADARVALPNLEQCLSVADFAENTSEVSLKAQQSPLPSQTTIAFGVDVEGVLDQVSNLEQAIIHSISVIAAPADVTCSGSSTIDDLIAYDTALMRDLEREISATVIGIKDDGVSVDETVTYDRVLVGTNPVEWIRIVDQTCDDKGGLAVASRRTAEELSPQERAAEVAIFKIDYESIVPVQDNLVYHQLEERDIRVAGRIYEVTITLEFLDGYVNTVEDLVVIQENKAKHFLETECFWVDE